MAKILRHYRITKETDALIKAEAARLEESEADVITRAVVRLCDAAADQPKAERPSKTLRIESPTQVAKAVRKVSKKERVVQERAASDVTAQIAGREDIDYSDTESTPGTSIADLAPQPIRRREPKIDAYRARGMRQKGDNSR